MWEIEYSDEVKFYFLDNGDRGFALLVKLEELSYTSTGMPPEGCTQLEPGYYWWEVLRHSVVYRTITENRLEILTVKPKA
jgi:hypothetical protein